MGKNPFLECKDYTVTGKSFQLVHDDERDLLETFPKPDTSELPAYYKSEKYISHTDARSSLTEKIYQMVKSFMLDKKLGWIEKEKKTKGKILDIGAGTGDFLFRAKKRGWDVTGVEPNQQAKDLALNKGLNFSVNSNSLPSDYFDVITLWHVLEHVPVLEDQISELKRLLKEDGIIIIAVPNFKSYDAHVYKEHWAAYDVPRHLWHFSKTSIKKIFSPYGFRIENIKALPFDAFYVSLLSETYKKSNFGYIKGIYIGLLSNLRALKSNEYSSMAYFLGKDLTKP